MNFPLKSKFRDGNKLKTIFVAVFFCLLFLLTYFFPQGVKNVFYFVSRPVFASRNFVANSVKNKIGYFAFKNDLIKKNIQLEDELTSYKLKEIDYNIVLKENEELKNLMGRSGTSNKVLSKILSKPPISPYDVFLIDVGLSNGFAKGDKVYLSGNIIIGTIVLVTTKTSLITLFSNGGQRQEATNTRTGTTYELTGRGGMNFQLEVPKEADIILGDVFEYPLLSPSIIGSVYYIDTNSQSSFKTIFLKIPGNVFSSKWVFVEKSQ